MKLKINRPSLDRTPRFAEKGSHSLAQHLRAPCNGMHPVSLAYSPRPLLFGLGRECPSRRPRGVRLSFHSSSGPEINQGGPPNSLLPPIRLTNLESCIRTDPPITRQDPPIMQLDLAVNSSNSFDGRSSPLVACPRFNMSQRLNTSGMEDVPFYYCE